MTHSKDSPCGSRTPRATALQGDGRVRAVVRANGPTLRALVRAVGWALALVCMAAVSSTGVAHDTGFGHSRRTIFVAVAGDKIVVEYRLTQSPEEALVEMTLMDRDRDGRISAEEQKMYFAERGKRLVEGLHCRSGEQRIPLIFQNFQLDQSLTQTFRCHLSAPQGPIMLEDRNFTYKPGLVRVRTGPGIRVELAQTTDLSHADRVQLKLTRANE